MAAIAAALAVQAVYAYEAAFAAADARLLVDAELAARHVGQVLTAVDLSLRSIDADPATPQIVIDGPMQALQPILQRFQRASPAIQALAVVGADGRVLVSGSAGAVPPADLSDRPYFVAHKAGLSPGLRLDPPVRSRPSNDVSIPVTRRIETRAGEFAGMIATRIDPDYFLEFFGRMDVGVAALVGADGTLFARYPRIDPVDAPKLAMPREGAGRAERTLRSAIDGRVYLVRAAGVQPGDLAVRVGEPVDGIALAWARGQLAPLLLAGFLLLAMGGGAWSLRRRERFVADELRFKDEAERVAKRQAELATEFSRRKSDYLAHMSHEIRTPLNAILGFSEIIANDTMRVGVHARYRDYAGDIHYSADHMLSVINQILDMAKIEAGMWEMAPSETALASLFDAVQRLCAQRAARENVEIVCDVPPPPDLALRCDERLVKQLLVNLAVNAIKFAGDDRRVVLGWQIEADGGLAISVADKGPGIRADDIERILRPFETARGEEARRRTDTGLGLPLSSKFVQLHGGRLAVHSVVGKGTRMVAHFPPERVVRPA